VICKICGEDKTPDLMRKNRGRRDSVCKACEAARVRAYYTANPDKKKEAQAKANARMKATGYKAKWLEEKRKNDPGWHERRLARQRERRKKTGSAGSKLRASIKGPLTPDQAEEAMRQYARYLLNRQIQLGNIVRGTCEICGSHESIHGHHVDYMRPLDVRWLCPVHHRREHIELVA
jgi:hypothetical protein